MVRFLYIFKKMSNSLIPSFIIRDVREWLRLLNKNKWWEHITQVTHKKWATMRDSLRSLTKSEQIARFFAWITHLIIIPLFVGKKKQFTKKTKERISNPGVHHTAESSSVVCIILTSRSVSLRWVWLLAVLANLGFANISMSDSAQC